MAGLLSNLQIGEIRTALNAVLNTFQVVPFTYIRMGIPLDRFMEDYPDRTSQSIEMVGIVSYETSQTDRIIEQSEGVIDEYDVMLELGTDYLDGLDLIDPVTFLPVFSTERDFFVINGQSFKVTLVVPDGNFEHRSILFKVFGKKQEIPA